MTQLVECVPNFSEGKDQQIIDQITKPILDENGVYLLDVDMGADFNRTVVTMVGEPEQVLKTVIQCTRIATSIIDMSKHTGEHARMGAVDVVPFIPISGTSMEQCVNLSRRYAESVSHELDLPVYLYAEAATNPNRVSLPNIRRGEYEGFEEKISHPDWAPDFGPSSFNSRMGVTATGARQVLIAYNVNLDTDDKAKANSIASSIRTSGSLLKDEHGQKIIGEDGKPIRKPGLFKSLQAAGWMYDESTAQVSMNLLDFSVTGLHDVTQAIREQASFIGLNVIAGELVGLVPLEAMLSAGRFYIGDDSVVDEKVLVQKAISGLMLDVSDDFEPESSIIEWAIKKVV
ncbi:MAG: glutamate formimidoyltransferase [Candidatus Thermoplasmatota archaeon]|nr:glutamate formimidoyltransferase [Candidatus Thermoplasmatota archaeon]MEC7425708.1 glutamate formimidoyltransferase [Candidatus Thermoplasmatota archaeon]MEC7458963.1 glutamate formimidoyltransferase [Candidatus Thermoplasmatota archaeon]MEC9136319.1 glutamate formimidoyltransferase [Candidatus Thermoplasmatota archaeon]